MLRISKKIQVGDAESGLGIYYIEGACTSADGKPTETVATGSLLLEADTGDLYTFDETGKTWNKL